MTMYRVYVSIFFEDEPGIEQAYEEHMVYETESLERATDLHFNVLEYAHKERNDYE
jgi:hypothetical protein